MTIQDIHNRLVQKFGDSKIPTLHEQARDPWIEVSAESWHEVASFLRTSADLKFDSLNNLTGVDYLELDPKVAKTCTYQPHLEVVYHLYSFTHKHSVVIKVKLPRWQNDQAGQIPEVASVCDVWPIADWHEREAYDLMGINFVGHPNLVRILCPEDWEGHPLRKDYKFPEEYHGVRG